MLACPTIGFWNEAVDNLDELKTLMLDATVVLREQSAAGNVDEDFCRMLYASEFVLGKGGFSRHIAFARCALNNSLGSKRVGGREGSSQLVSAASSSTK